MNTIRLLRELSNPRLAELAEATGTPQPAIARRLERFLELVRTCARNTRSLMRENHPESGRLFLECDVIQPTHLQDWVLWFSSGLRLGSRDSPWRRAVPVG